MRIRLLAAFLLVPAALMACGSDDDNSSAPATTEASDVTDVELDPIDERSGNNTTSEKPDVDVPDTSPSELVITDLVAGTGRAAEAGDSVVVDYVGVRTADGAEFDNSYDRGTPLSVRLGQGMVIPGWDEGLVGSQTGMRRQLDIPAEMAYGDSPPPGSVIEAGDALTFVVDVRAVIASVGESDAPTDLDIETSSGRTELGIVDVTEGDGAELELGHTAIAHLMLLRGDDLELIESTWAFDDPAQIVMAPGNAIEGLIDGLLGMRVGGLRVITIPPALAFGPNGIPEAGVDGDDDVIIVVELVGLY